MDVGHIVVAFGNRTCVNDQEGDENDDQILDLDDGVDGLKEHGYLHCVVNACEVHHPYYQRQDACDAQDEL